MTTPIFSGHVPYRTEASIEQDAKVLLAAYGRASRRTPKVPIPIEDIVEKHLKLSMEFDDTHRLFSTPRTDGQTDILGAIIFDERRIVIDESLDPVEHPAMEGRYRFTLAHEGGGHWCLHRAYFESKANQGDLFDVATMPTVVCRSSQKKAPVEWQADYFAACVLMPRDLVFQVWREVFPDGRPRVIEGDEPMNHMYVEVARVRDEFCGMDWSETIEEAMERVARPLAGRFLVSPHAMRIRLEELGLLCRDVRRAQRI